VRRQETPRQEQGAGSREVGRWGDEDKKDKRQLS